MYQTVFSDDVLCVTQSGYVWRLERRGQLLAIIEPAWDDHHWLLFIPDETGELVCLGARRRVAALKAFLRLWTRRTLANSPQSHSVSEPPE